MANKSLTFCLVGDKGSGKSLFMCIICLLFEISNKPYYTNFKIIGDNIKNRIPFTIKKFYENPNIEGIFLDETHNIADQYANPTLPTKLLVALFTQSRKRNQLIFFATQQFYKLSKDFRLMTDIIVFPKHDEFEDRLVLIFWNLRTQKVSYKTIHNVSRFYNYYDTNEIIVSKEIKKGLSNYMLNEVKLNKEIDKELNNDDKALLNKIEEDIKK